MPEKRHDFFADVVAQHRPDVESHHESVWEKFSELANAHVLTEPMSRDDEDLSVDDISYHHEQPAFHEAESIFEKIYGLIGHHEPHDSTLDAVQSEESESSKEIIDLLSNWNTTVQTDTMLSKQVLSAAGAHFVGSPGAVRYHRHHRRHHHDDESIWTEEVTIGLISTVAVLFVTTVVLACCLFKKVRQLNKLQRSMMTQSECGVVVAVPAPDSAVAGVLVEKDFIE